jgi:eukaryotic-like serine/threonine-protein kinase
MRALQSRLNKLELVWNTAKEPRSVFRVIVSAIAKPLNWETSTCTRTLSANGSLLEVLILDGNSGQSSDRVHLIIASMQLVAGDKLGPYEILMSIGAGGMGEVYKARDTRLNRVVAIKTIDQGRSWDRFHQEARAIAALNHPHICQLYDVGPNYLVMEFIDGRPLYGPLQPDQALRYAMQICDALSTAHKHNITHRDLKPDNILVTSSGIKLLDFGLAKIGAARAIAATAPLGSETITQTTSLTEAGTILGTASYMSPEQAKGEEADARSDIFSFGLVLYEMLSGRRAFVRNSAVETMAAILSDDPAPLDAPPKLSAVVFRCLRKLPAERFQTIDEVRSALENTTPPKGVSQTLSSEVPSIAVLPFAIMSADKENEFFGDGLAEDIINGLTHLPNLKVAARTSAFSFRARNSDIAEIGRKLDVAHVLEGSVRKSANRIRVTVQLTNVRDGFHLWSERYDRELTDVFAIQDEISDAVVQYLKVSLVNRAENWKRHLPNIDAYEAYLKGRFFWNKRTEPDFDRSIEHFSRAIDLDPEYALAHVGIADACILLGIFGLRRPKEIFEKARLSAETALRLDERSAEALLALATVLGYHDWDWAAAERLCQRAVTLDPNSAHIRFWHGSLLSAAQQREQASEEVKRARDLDPLSVPINGYLGIVFSKAGRHNEAVAASMNAVELDPASPFAHWMLARCLDARNDFQPALIAAEKAASLSGSRPPFLAALGYAYAKVGDRSKSELIFEQLREQSKTRYISPYDTGIIYVALGNDELALERLTEAFDQKAPRIVEIADPVFERMRTNSRIQTFLKKMNISSS